MSALDDAHSVAPADTTTQSAPSSPHPEDLPAHWDLPLSLLRQLYLGSDGASRTVSVEPPYERRGSFVPPPSASSPPPAASGGNGGGGGSVSDAAPSPGGGLSIAPQPSFPGEGPPALALGAGLGSGSGTNTNTNINTNINSTANANANTSTSPSPSPSPSPSTNTSSVVRSLSMTTAGSEGLQRKRSARQAAVTGRSVLSSTAQHRPQWGSTPMTSVSSNRSLHRRGVSGGSDQTRTSASEPTTNTPLRLVTYSPAQRAPYLPTRALKFAHKKRILVTGGAGFVGSHLVDRLMLMGHEVLVVDNFFTGNKDNISHWVGHPNFEVVRHDVVNSLLVEVDQIYHLACPASPKAYQVNPVKTIKTNFQGTLNMLGLAKRTKSRFLLASTSEVYGDPSVHPQPETYHGNVNQTGPRGCYDEGKRIAETLTYGYFYQDGVDVRVARIFNTYGPRMHPYDGRVVSNFILQGLKGEPLTVYGDGHQTRSFMFIHDLVDGLIALMEAEPDTDAPDLAEYDDRDDEPELGVHGPVNLGNMWEFTIKELVQAVAEAIQHVRVQQGRERLATPTRSLIDHEHGGQPVSSSLSAAPTASGQGLEQDPGTGQGAGGGESSMALSSATPDGKVREYICGLEIVYCPIPTDDPQKRRPDNTRAQALLNWHPRWSLKEGLIEMVHYYQQKLDVGEL